MPIGDIGTFSLYTNRIGLASGVMAAGLAASSPVFAAHVNAAYVKKVRILGVNISVAVDATGFTAGSALFRCFAARGYTAADTGGAALTYGGNDQKMRTAQNLGQAFTAADIQIATTGTLTAGTRTLDHNPVGVLVGAAGAAGSQIVVPNTAIYIPQSPLASDDPLVLAANEGFIIDATVPAVGTWRFGVNVLWTELDGGLKG